MVAYALPRQDTLSKIIEQSYQFLELNTFTAFLMRSESHYSIPQRAWQNSFGAYSQFCPQQRNYQCILCDNGKSPTS
jgi:hypothetical protein